MDGGAGAGLLAWPGRQRASYRLYIARWEPMDRGVEGGLLACLGRRWASLQGASLSS